MATTLQPDRPFTCFLSLAVPGRSRIPKPRSLMEAVECAVQQVAEDRLRPGGGDCRTLALQPRTMLGALTYCYARQVYAASEILEHLTQDDAFAKVCQGEFPNARELESFRRENRALLEICLIAALRFLAEEKVTTGFVTRVNESFIAEEAKRRIIMAACMDSLELAYENQPWLNWQ